MTGDGRDPGPAGIESDPAQLGLDLVKRRWALAVGFVGWLATVIGPAISFDVKLSLKSTSGPQFEAFFLVVTAALFLLAWRSLDRLPVRLLPALFIAAVGLFVTYMIAKDSWTCAYYPNRFDERFVMGTDAELLAPIRAFLAAHPPPDGTCESLMEMWGGDAAQIWEWKGIVGRFLALFGLYAFAWMSLALLILAAVKRGLAKWPGGQ